MHNTINYSCESGNVVRMDMKYNNVCETGHLQELPSFPGILGVKVRKEKVVEEGSFIADVK